ncbi:MAG TPA: glycosyltransferase family 87 protein [Candidatus Obscuribacterales bacterium]
MSGTKTKDGTARGLKVCQMAKAAGLLLMSLWAVAFYGLIYVQWQAGQVFKAPKIGFIDFVYFYAASLATKRWGGSSSAYDADRFYLCVAEAMAPERLAGRYAFEYPPIVLPLLRPLAELSLSDAYAAWVSLGILSLGAALCAICRSYGPGTFSRSFLVIGTLASFPVWLAARCGQSTLFLTAAAVYAWLRLRQGRHFLSGAVAAVTLIKIQFAPTLIVAGLALGGLRFLSGLACALIPLVAAALVTAGPDCFASFVHTVAATETSTHAYTHLVPERMQNLRGQLFVITGADTQANRTATSLAFILAVLATVMLWLRIYPRQQQLPPGIPLFELAAAISCLVLLVFSPHAYIYDYCILVIVCPFLWVWATASQKNFGHRLSTSLLRWLLIGFPALSWPFGLYSPLLERAGVESFFVWAVVALALALDQLRLVWALTAPGQAEAICRHGN